MRSARRRVAAAVGAVALIAVITYANAANLPLTAKPMTAVALNHPCPGTATVTNTDVGLSLGTVQVTLPAGCASATTTRTVQVKLIVDDDEYTSAAVTMSAQSQTVAVTPGYTAPGAMTARVTADGWDVPATWSYTVQERRLQLHEPFQDSYLRHRGVGTNTPACLASRPNDRGVCLEEIADQNTVFRVVEGLASPGTTGLVSFESVSNPGYYLRRQNDVVYLLAAPTTDTARGAATFEMTPGLWNAAPPWLSFKAYGTNKYLRHYYWRFRTDTQETGDVYRKDATIRFVTP